MKRIIVDSQDNPLFLGDPLEQAYSLRGGLCQIGGDGILVLPNPIDLEYLWYWKEIVGLDLPKMIVTEPHGDGSKTVTQLLLEDQRAQALLREAIGKEEARLEFFCVDKDEQRLAEVLGIAAYVGFDVAMRLARKANFKLWWEQLEIPTPEWTVVNWTNIRVEMKRFLGRFGATLAKFNEGTGGVSCGGMFLVRTDEDVESALNRLEEDKRIQGSFILEQLMEESDTFSFHWEITGEGDIVRIGTFRQRGELSYSGVEYPVKLPARTEKRIAEDISKMTHALREEEGKGYFCGDAVIDPMGNQYWVDLNPRKGAILYVFDVVRRIGEHWQWERIPAFVHQHTEVPWMKGQSFSTVKNLLDGLLDPRPEGFILVTNPGVMEFGYLDITGIASSSESAKSVLEEARRRLGMKD